jgi:flavin reductase (DIM6/NTAB) family NADH-FMN oxidoreductase RutF
MVRWFKSSIRSDTFAVIDLPMRLVVSLIIGSVALGTIVSFMMQPCLFPRSLSVSIDPLSLTINNTSSDVSFLVHVIDDANHPVSDALVIIKGNYDVASNMTDETGYCHLSLTVYLPDGISEGYLDVQIKASCKTTFDQKDIIRIVKQV